jgi:pimeloyl-ACP methyl ester carboxylesterase
MSPTRHLRRYVLRVCAAVVLATSLFGVAAPAQAKTDSFHCSTHNLSVRLADPGPANYTLWGQLCFVGATTPHTVQLLVPGATYTHLYWDFPYASPYYSYVRAATAAHYATFNVDRISTGNSSRPPSADVTMASEAVALHDAISALRSGAVGGTPFQKVLWVGHSYGSMLGQVEIARYHDVDGYLDTGMLHSFTDAFAATVPTVVWPAGSDPKFAGLGLDPGYFTTIPGTRGQIWYDAQTSDPNVIAQDEATKDVLSINALTEIPALLLPPSPADAVSRQIDVPVLVVVGGRDFIFCGSPGGADCSSANSVRAYESPYYAPGANVQFAVIPNTGHDLALSITTPATSAIMLAWAYTVALP